MSVGADLAVARGTDADRRAAIEEWRRGWPVVLAATIGYGTGGAVLAQTASLLIVPMRTELGWSTSAVTFMPIVLLVWALVSPLAGAVIDKLGARTAAIGGTLAVGLCTFLLAVVPITQTMLFGIAALLGVFSALTVVATYTRGVATWFSTGVGLAFGVTLSGSALVAIGGLPLVSGAIQAGGWRAGLFAIGSINLFIGLPVILLGFRERSFEGEAARARANERNQEGKTVGEAVRDLRFWLYISSFVLGCIPIGGFGTHLQPLLADQGIVISTAVWLGILFAISASIGKIVGGLLLDRFWPFAVAMALLMVGAAGALVLAGASMSMPFVLLALAVGIVGMGQGAEADFIAYFSLRTFGMRAFATIVSIFGTLGTASVALGGAAFSFIFDARGSYALGCYAAAGSWALSAVLLLLAGFVERRRGADRS